MFSLLFLYWPENPAKDILSQLNRDFLCIWRKARIARIVIHEYAYRYETLHNSKRICEKECEAKVKGPPLNRSPQKEGKHRGELFLDGSFIW